jgi:hypothetical protein
MINEDETIVDFKFIGQLANNAFLFWFYDMRLVKIQLYFKDKLLTNVKTERIGNLGIEITHL